MFDHGVILGIVAGSEDDALFRVGEDVFAGFGIAQISASAAAVFHQELHGKVTVTLFYIPSGDCCLHVLIHVDTLVRQEFHRRRIAGEGLLAPVIVFRQGQKDGDEEVARILVGDGGPGLVGIVELRVRCYPPVENLADVVGPFGDDAALTLVTGLHHVEVDHPVDIFLGKDVTTPAVLDIAVDDRVLTAAALGTAGLVDRDDFCALLRRGTDSRHPRNAAADDQHVGADLFFYIRSCDLRGLTKPVIVRSCLCRRFPGCSGSRAGRLGNAVVDRGAHCVAGDGRAGYCVDLAALRVEYGLLQQGAGTTAEFGSLTRGVDHNVENAGFVKGHGDSDFTLQTLGLCSISAGDVLCCSLGMRGKIRACAEHTRSRDAEGSGSGALEKISARNELCHVFSSLYLYFFLVLKLP